MTRASGGQFRARRAVPGDEAAWRRITEASADTWLGHDWEWNRIVEEGVWGARDESLIVERRGEPVGIVPLHVTERRLGPLRRRLLHSNWWLTGGPAFASPVSEDERAAALSVAMAATHEVGRRSGADKLVVRLPPLARRTLGLPPAAPNPLCAYGVDDRSTRAIVLRLAGRSERDVWDGMEGRSRTAVRKAQREGVTVRRLPREEAASAYYPLHLATYGRTGAAPLPERYFATILRSAWSNVFAAYHGGALVALVNVAFYAGRAFYWTNASLDVAAKLGANNLLQWEALRWMLANGATAYELGELPSDDAARAAPKLAALAMYKRSFGGEAIPYHRAERVYAGVRERALRLVSTVRRSMP